MAYKRVMIKLSGEMLGKVGILFDHGMIDRVASVLTAAAGRGLAIGVVIGAGNIWRGRQGTGMDAVTADHMGMLGTVINCLYMRDAIERAGGNVTLYSAFGIDHIADSYSPHRVKADMAPGRIVLLAGGTGNPFFSTDTGVVLRAVELNADVLLMAKNIDGVYTADPKSDPNAQLIRAITYEDAIARNLRVMDQSAFCICRDQRLPFVRVFKLDEPENILKVLDGDDRGTTLYPSENANR